MQDQIDQLTNDLMAVAGSAVVRIHDAARLAMCSESTIRRAIGCGELTCSRQVANGPVLIRVRELARWIVRGEQRSLPNPGGDDGRK